MLTLRTTAPGTIAGFECKTQGDPGPIGCVYPVGNVVCRAFGPLACSLLLRLRLCVLLLLLVVLLPLLCQQQLLLLVLVVVISLLLPSPPPSMRLPLWWW